MKLFNLINLVTVGRNIKRNPMGAGLELVQDYISPIFLVPVLLLGSISIIFGVLYIIFHYTLLQVVFWIVAPITLLACGIHIIVIRLTGSLASRVSGKLQKIRSTQNMSRDSAAPGTINTQIVDVDYSE